MSQTAADSESGLVRAIGVRALTASIVNVTIGAGIFVLPAQVAGEMGNAAPVAYLFCALVMLLVVASFAVAGSRVSLTGGLYAYIEVAFGPFIGFLGGVVQWLSAILAVAGVAAALMSSLAITWPALREGPARAAALAALFGALALVNIRGVRQGAGTVEVMTAAKLLPLALFVAVGIFAIDPAAVGWTGMPSGDAVGRTALVLIFAFVGVEIALVPSGEILRPSRTVPAALFIALTVTALFYLAIQLVAQGVLGSQLATFADAPLAEAASRFLGRSGTAILLLGGTVSMFGYMSGDMLGTPRALFAFGRDGFLPRAFASVHPRFHTPHVAIAAHAVLVTVLASIGTFGHLTLLSNVAVLTLYFLACLAAFELTRRDVRGTGAPPLAMPGARVVPLLGALVVLWLLSHATKEEFLVEAAVLGVAALLFALRRAIGGPTRTPPRDSATAA